MNDFADRRVTVMGLGRFGGGLGVTRFLAQRGAQVLVTDTLPAEELAESIAALQDLVDAGRVTLRLGEHRTEDFTDTDLVVVNPAVRPGNAFVEAARSAGVPITSEIRLLVQHLPNRLKTIGVTGSAGKSTTTAMIAHLLRKLLGQEGEKPRRQDAKTSGESRSNVEAFAERAAVEDGGDSGGGVWMGGNIGGSLLPYVDQILPEDWVVLELSSFMLEGLWEEQWSPHVAVITNISPNHLDWHGSMESYVEAKRAIMLFQDPERDTVFLDESAALAFDGGRNPHDPEWQVHPDIDGCIIDGPLCIDEPYPLTSLAGYHNECNAALAHMVVVTVLREDGGEGWMQEAEQDSEWRKFRAAKLDFAGLPHRLEALGQVHGIICYNDSKSTTPSAVINAVDAFVLINPDQVARRTTAAYDSEVRIILGGYDKGSDFAEAAEFVAQHCRGVYTIGDTGDSIADLVEAEVSSRSTRCVVRRCGTLEVAVREALREAQGGEVLLLSPGCASWDQFANYEERGRRFVELVRAAGEGPQGDKQKPTD